MGEFSLDNSWQQKKSLTHTFRLLGTLGKSSFKEFTECICAFFFNINLCKLDFFYPAAIFSTLVARQFDLLRVTK